MEKENSDKTILRNLTMGDVQELIEIANDKNIANDMITLPSPFGKEDALQIINESNGSNVIKGIVEAESENLVGVVKLRDFDKEHERIELSFWISSPWWGKGLAANACKKVLKIAFETPGINRVYAYNLARNEHSSKVLQKIGMEREGLLRQRVKKNGVFEDVYVSAILRKTWRAISNKG